MHARTFYRILLASLNDLTLQRVHEFLVALLLLTLRIEGYPIRLFEFGRISPNR